MKLLKEFKAKYAEYEQTRQELTNAEKLFDLPITGYPHLLEVEKELKSLSQVFELYEAQRVSRDSFSAPVLSRMCLMQTHMYMYTSIMQRYIHVRTCVHIIIIRTCIP